MSIEQVDTFTTWLMTFMQLSILVPMAVVWRRRAQFPAAIRLLSWYVYLSAFFSLSARLSGIYLHNSLFFLIGFNVAKVLLFAAVYRLVLTAPRMRKAVAVSTLIILGMVAASFAMGAAQALTVSRVTQCALLAGFALAYLEQLLSRVDGRKPSRNPIWLVGLGQLIYSAATVSVFSIDILFNFHSPLLNVISTACLSVATLVFNYFLTLAFLRAKPDAPVSTATAVTPSGMLVAS